jgi:PAS domain S-box-containing protein
MLKKTHLTPENPRNFCESPRSPVSNEKQSLTHLCDEGMRRRALMEASRDGIAIIDQEHRVVEANPSFAAMLGYSEGEVIGLHTWDFEAILSEEQIRGAFSDLSRTNAVFETKHRRRDGTVYDAEVCASGTLVGGQPMVLTISRDISERKRAEKALRQNEERFRLAFHIAPDASVIVRLGDGCFVDVNQSFIDNTGYTKDQVVGKTSLDFNFWVNLADRRRLYERLLAHGQVRNMETTLRNGKGQPIAVLVSAAVFDLEGEPHFFFSARSVQELKSVEARLRVSEARNRQILQTAMDGFCRVDERGRIIEVNQAYCRMTGYAAEELLSMSLGDLDVMMDEKQIKSQLQILLDKGYDRFESRKRRKDGSVFDVEISAQRRRTQNDGVEFVSFLRDITEAKRAGWIFQQLHTLGLKLSHATTVEETLRLALAAALAISNLDCGGVYLFDPPDGGLRLVEHQGMPPALAARVARLTPEDPRVHLVAQGRPAYLEAVSFAGIDPGLEETLGSLAVIPILYQGRAVACLNLGSFSHREIAYSARGPIESLATQLSGYVGRSLLEEKLRDSRAGYSALFDHTPVAVWEQDLSVVKAVLDRLGDQGVTDISEYFSRHPQELGQCILSAKILKVNRESALLFKCGSTVEINTNLHRYFTEASYGAFAQAFAALARGQMTMQAELPIIDRRGGRRELMARLAVCPGYEHDFSRVLVSFLDITEVNRTTDLLRQTNRKLHVIGECRKALLHLDHEADLLMEICRIICQEARHAMAWVAIREETEISSLRVAAVYGHDDGYLTQVQTLLLQDETGAAACPLHAAIHGGRAIIVDDFESYEGIDGLRQAALQRGYRSSAYLPMKDEGGRVFATLNIYSKDAGTFSEAEMELMAAIANDLAYGIGFLRIRVAQQRNSQVNHARIDLIRFAQKHNLGELLEETLNVAEQLTASSIGFYHFIDESKGAISLQAWSRRTKDEFCAADESDRHYDLAAAGVWVDCVHRRQAMIYNDYPSLPQRKGLPAGHAEVRRFITVPVTRDGEVKAIFAVGNKNTAYGYQDVEVLSLLADLAWEIAERKREEARREEIESQLRQAQKMEAIGTLAGGIAHDFNNILGAIVGYGEMALEDAYEGKVVPADIQQILNAADRAKTLVKQILTFSRKVEVNYKPLDLNRQVEQAVQLLGKTLPRMVALQVQLGRELWTINADANQIGQILFNLVVNGADAMDGEGVITVATSNIVVDEQTCITCGKVFSGPYVAIEVGDSGKGMDEETRRHIFEPFYTTKEVGKGTGLGLSTVYGIVVGHGGHVACHSAPGKGTRFTVYFPVHGLKESIGSAEGLTRTGVGGGKGELILVVDDEEPIRSIATRQLQRAGYRTVTADCGEKALHLYTEQRLGIELIIMDLSMPGQGGYKTLQQLLAIDPQVKVVIASGYSATGQISDSLDIGAADYLLKPFNQGQLLAMVRRVLDEKAS